LGLHHEAWPPGPRPNPFLPLALQRRHGMPHASVTRETELARGVTERMLASAPDIVVSHPMLDEERELGPSPLIEHLPEVVPGALPASDIPELRRVIATAGGTEPFLDFQGPGLEEGATPRGGTAVFRDQAACPFRAFATHRLNARPIEDAVDGLDAAERGTLVHRVLDLAWERLGDHASLAALVAQGGKALDDFCGAVVDAALGERFDRGNPMDRLRALEQLRVTALLRDWLLTELERPPFVVESRETKRICTLGGITVTGRVDRIDRMPDGRRIVLDYKTGRVSLGEWFGERPDQPQLPIYCTSEAVPPAGVAFARVRTGEFALVGLADDPALFPGARPILKQLPDEIHGGREEDTSPQDNAPARLQALWAEPLHRLGEAFRTGDARVDPKKFPATCAYCGLDALCRIADIAGTSDESEEMTGERDD